MGIGTRELPSNDISDVSDALGGVDGVSLPPGIADTNDDHTCDNAQLVALVNDEYESFGNATSQSGNAASQSGVQEEELGSGRCERLVAARPPPRPRPRQVSSFSNHSPPAWASNAGSASSGGALPEIPDTPGRGGSLGSVPQAEASR